MAYRIVHELNARHIDDLCALYATTWWTDKRARNGIEAMLKTTSLVFGLVREEDDALVGFCRVLSDFVYRGTLYDVIVREDLRGQGLSRVLIDAVVNHPRLKTVEFIDLTCLPDKIDLYAKWGWQTDQRGVVRLNRKARG